MKFKRLCLIYLKYVKQYLKTVLEYPTDTIIRILAMAVMQFSGYAAIWAVFQNIPDIVGWNFWEIVLIYSTMSMVIGIGELFFEGIWTIAKLSGEGKLDIYILRPIPILLQVLVSSLGIHGFGNFITALIFFLQAAFHLSLSISAARIFIFIILLLTALPIHFSLLLIANSVALFTKEVHSGSLPTLILKLSEFTKYPLSIYPRILQFVFTFIVPYAFVSFFPATFLLEKSNYSLISLSGPIISALFLVFATRFFHFGLTKYESSGN